MALVAHAAGADEQLRLCVEWLAEQSYCVAADQLASAMRPTPPSLKQQALEDLESIAIKPCVIRKDDEFVDLNEELHAKYLRIRRAIESLPD